MNNEKSYGIFESVHFFNEFKFKFVPHYKMKIDNEILSKQHSSSKNTQNTKIDIPKSKEYSAEEANQIFALLGKASRAAESYMKTFKIDDVDLNPGIPYTDDGEETSSTNIITKKKRAFVNGSELKGFGLHYNISFDTRDFYNKNGNDAYRAKVKEIQIYLWNKFKDFYKSIGCEYISEDSYEETRFLDGQNSRRYPGLAFCFDAKDCEFYITVQD